MIASPLGLALGLSLALPGPAHAQATAAPSGDSGILLQLHDADGQLKGEPVVRIEGWAGPELRPLDDGKGADRHAGDRVYGIRLDAWPGGSARITLTDGQQTWQGRGEGKAGEQLWVRVRERGRLQVGDGTVQPVGSGADAEGRSPLPQGSPTLDLEGAQGPAVRLALLLWGAVSLAFLVGLGGALAWLRWSRSAAPVPLDVAVAPGAPTTVASHDELPEILGELGPRRLVIVGPTPMILPANIRPVQSPTGILPDELVDAIEALALRGGDPVAVLVMDADALDRPTHGTALQRLEAALAGRCPLVVLDHSHSRWHRPAA